jgi:hypothetical protein
MTIGAQFSLNRYLQKNLRWACILFANATWPSLQATYNWKDAAETGPHRLQRSPQIVLPSLGEPTMLWTITIILFILWILGLVSSYTLGGWIHILLVLAIIVLIFNLLSGRRAL